MAKKAVRPKPRRQPRQSMTWALKETIRARGLSCQKLGELTGLNPSLISRFLAGVRDVRLETADILADALGIKVVTPSLRATKRPLPPQAVEREAEIEAPAEPTVTLGDGPTHA